MLKKRLFFCIYILLACSVLRGIFYFQHLASPLSLSSPEIVEIAPGTGFNRVLARLADQGAVTHPFDLKLFGRLSGKAQAIQAGEYELVPGMTHEDLLDKLVAGEVVMHQVIIVEGRTLMQALVALQEHPGVTAELSPENRDQLQQLLSSEVYPEGMIFPDTYRFSSGTTDRALLLQGRDLMQQVLEEEWSARDVGLPYDTPYEALIMASIIEKETGRRDEREQIAGVFVRRLQRGMRLQTDPTVIYGMGERFQGNLTRTDLRTPNPYNTYLNKGLPPTPIALPGRDSIHASLHPDQGDTLYFVARGDGSHYFSTTLEEHEQAVQQYQLGSESEP
jgi:UPF0755 protein